MYRHDLSFSPDSARPSFDGGRCLYGTLWVLQAVNTFCNQAGISGQIEFRRAVCYQFESRT
jgi:hypothetical protein